MLPAPFITYIFICIYTCLPTSKFLSTAPACIVIVAHRSLAEYKAISREGQLACVHDAEFRLRSGQLLGGPGQPTHNLGHLLHALLVRDDNDGGARCEDRTGTAGSLGHTWSYQGGNDNKGDIRPKGGATLQMSSQPADQGTSSTTDPAPSACASQQASSPAPAAGVLLLQNQGVPQGEEAAAAGSGCSDSTGGGNGNHVRCRAVGLYALERQLLMRAARALLRELRLGLV